MDLSWASHAPPQLSASRFTAGSSRGSASAVLVAVRTPRSFSTDKKHSAQTQAQDIQSLMLFMVEIVIVITTAAAIGTVIAMAIAIVFVLVSIVSRNSICASSSISVGSSWY